MDAQTFTFSENGKRQRWNFARSRRKCPHVLACHVCSTFPLTCHWLWTLRKWVVTEQTESCDENLSVVSFSYLNLTPHWSEIDLFAWAVCCPITDYVIFSGELFICPSKNIIYSSTRDYLKIWKEELSRVSSHGLKWDKKPPNRKRFIGPGNWGSGYLKCALSLSVFWNYCSG